METTINNIPVFNALITDDEDGMLKVSLVDYPAVMSDFLAFKEERKPMAFAIKDEEKRLVYGVLMRADFPIYRVNGDYEYFLIFKADTIRQMAEKYLKEGRQNDVNVMHEEGSDVEGVDMVQMFIKDSAKGVDPKGFPDIADGSLFAEYHINNDEVWDAIKSGEFKGFSLEGYFDIQPTATQAEADAAVEGCNGKFSKVFQEITNKIEDMSKMNKIKEALARMLVHFAKLTTDKGIIQYEGDEIAEGVEVTIVAEDGTTAVAEDGEYIAEDIIIVVKDGKVAEIREKEVEEEPAEEIPAVEAEQESEGMEVADEDFAKLREDVDQLRKEMDEAYKLIDGLAEKAGVTRDELDALKESMAKMAKEPAAEPAHKVEKKEEMSRAERMANAMRVARENRR